EDRRSAPFVTLGGLCCQQEAVQELERLEGRVGGQRVPQQPEGRQDVPNDVRRARRLRAFQQREQVLGTQAALRSLELPRFGGPVPSAQEHPLDAWIDDQQVADIRGPRPRERVFLQLQPLAGASHEREAYGVAILQ